MPDWIGLASATPRREFSRQHHGWYLVGQRRVVVDVPPPTMIVRAPAEGAQAASLVRVVAPVCKVQDPARAMISLGRSESSDIVLLDRTVSRHHAYFREVAGRVEVVDAGSRNETRVNGTPLRPRDGVRLYGGEHLRFGGVDLVFVDASGCWEFLQRVG